MRLHIIGLHTDLNLITYLSKEWNEKLFLFAKVLETMHVGIVNRAMFLSVWKGDQLTKCLMRAWVASQRAWYTKAHGQDVYRFGCLRLRIDIRIDRCLLHVQHSATNAASNICIQPSCIPQPCIGNSRNAL
jgi:hypothetical protein